MSFLFFLLVSFPLFCFAQRTLPTFTVSNEDIKNLVNQLRNNDENKAKSRQIQLNFQGHTGSADSNDRASRPSVDSSLLRKPTYSKLIDLLDNFERETGITEVDTVSENEEVDEFLNAVFNTKPWKTFQSFLSSKNHPFAKDEITLKRMVKQLWFEHYSRARGLPDTSGFEHVFVGEVKNNEISGLHNWIRFYELERNPKSSFDYKGFLVKRGNKMAAVKFSWGNQTKRAGSLLIGSSPEFDFSLYTLCFLSRRSRNTCDFEIDGCPMSITSYDIVQNHKIFIGSIFPSAGRMTDQCRRQFD